MMRCGEGSGSGDAVKKTKFKWKEGDKNEIFLREIMHKTNEGVDSLQTSYDFRGNRQSLRISPRILAESLRILRNFMVLTSLDPCEKPLKS